jgi:hypothetical protein
MWRRWLLDDWFNLFKLLHGRQRQTDVINEAALWARICGALRFI